MHVQQRQTHQLNEEIKLSIDQLHDKNNRGYDDQSLMGGGTTRIDTMGSMLNARRHEDEDNDIEN